MKRFLCAMILKSADYQTSVSLPSESLWDVIEEAQEMINQKYPGESSIARKIATEELERIARSGKTEKEKIAVIREKFLMQKMINNAVEKGDAKAQINLGDCY